MLLVLPVLPALLVLQVLGCIVVLGVCAGLWSSGLR